MSWKKEFSRFLEARPGVLHCAAHSHHYWPDVTFAAQQQAWLDAERLADSKWQHVFGEVLPGARRRVAAVLGTTDPDAIAFAANTHEILVRLVSCVERAPVRILTSGSEFHSFTRQARRWEEAGSASVERVPVEPFETFEERFLARAAADFDLVYLSHVHFDSGYVFRES